MAGPQFRYHRKNDPNYNPYGTRLTERQERIIRGVDINSVSLGEINTLINKLEKLGDSETAMLVYEMYEELIAGKDESKYTTEEAIAIIENMMPWKMNWEPHKKTTQK